MFARFFMQLSFVQSHKVKKITPCRIFRVELWNMFICSCLQKNCFSVCHHIIFKSNKTTVYIWQTGLICIYGKLSVILQNTFAIKMLNVHSSKVTFTYRERTNIISLYVVCCMLYFLATSIVCKKFSLLYHVYNSE